jgi:probable HAF family extracellular repeat protein
MNIHHCYTPRNLILAVVLTIGFASSALAQVALLVDLNSKEVTHLGTLDGDAGWSDYSRASGINDRGQVVGGYHTGAVVAPTHAFITGPDGVGMTDLGTLGGDSVAYGINDSGQVVGDFKTDKGWPPHAFITGPDGAGMTDLGALGGDFSTASGINDAGQVIGLSSTDNGQAHTFITGPDGAGMTDLAR